MSLINRVLRDLSARKPAAGDVMSGIEVPAAPVRQRTGAAGRLGLLLVLVAGFTAGLWWLFGRQPIPVPRPLAADQGPAVAAAPDEAAAVPPAEPVLHEPPPIPPQAAPAPARPEPARAPNQPAAAAGREGEAPTRLQMATELSTPVGPPARKPRRATPEQATAPASASAAPPAGRIAGPQAEESALPAGGVRSASQAAELHREGLRALERGDERGAENAFARALGLDPKLHASREELGKLRIGQGRLEDAARSVRRGLEEAPQWIGYRRLAARLDLARGDARAALALLERNPPAVADDVEYHGLLASAYQRLGRHEDAGRTYQGLTRAQPAVAQWWAGYGLARDALGDAAGALAAYDRARALGGLDARVLEHINQRASALMVGG